MEAATGIRLTRTKLNKLANNPEKSAEIIDLVYVSDTEPGIKRVKQNKYFSYFLGDKKIEDKATLQRINKLVLPPAWKEVWICTNPKGHLQATGIDTRNRKQYKYHDLWTRLRNHTKFNMLYSLGRNLPAIRAQIQKDLAKKGLPQEKVLAVV